MLPVARTARLAQLDLKINDAYKNDAYKAAWSPDGKNLAIATYNSGPLVLDNTLSTSYWPIDFVPANRVYDLAFSPDQPVLICATAKKEIPIYGATTWHQIGKMTGATFPVYRVQFSEDGNRAISFGWNNRNSNSAEIVLWDFRRRIPIKRRAVDGYVFTALAPDGHSVAIGTMNSQLKLWNSEIGDDVLTLLGNSAEVTAVAFSPSNDALASGGVDRSLHVWKAVPRDQADENPSVLLTRAWKTIRWRDRKADYQRTKSALRQSVQLSADPALAGRSLILQGAADYRLTNYESAATLLRQAEAKGLAGEPVLICFKALCQVATGHDDAALSTFAKMLIDPEASTFVDSDSCIDEVADVVLPNYSPGRAGARARVGRRSAAADRRRRSSRKGETRSGTRCGAKRC